MTMKIFAFAVAMLAPVAGNAAEPAPTPKAECCCCEKAAEGKMKCCDEMKRGDKSEAGDHAGHDMSGKDHK